MRYLPGLDMSIQHVQHHKYEKKKQALLSAIIIGPSNELSRLGYLFFLFSDHYNHYQAPLSWALLVGNLGSI